MVDRLTLLEDRLAEAQGDEAFLLGKIRELNQKRHELLQEIISYEEQLADHYSGLTELEEEIALLKEAQNGPISLR